MTVSSNICERFPNEPIASPASQWLHCSMRVEQELPVPSFAQILSAGNSTYASAALIISQRMPVLVVDHILDGEPPGGSLVWERFNHVSWGVAKRSPIHRIFGRAWLGPGYVQSASSHHLLLLRLSFLFLGRKWTAQSLLGCNGSSKV
jgi:hypothetical protein